MGVLVKLNSIIEAIDVQISESSSYLNKKTGEILMFVDEELTSAEEEDSMEDCPGWQRENILAAREMLDHEDDYLQLPSAYDINQYRIMEKFCFSVESREISEALRSTIKGKGAFRRFRDALNRLDCTDEWYKYRALAIRQIAIDWCDSNHIEFVDE